MDIVKLETNKTDKEKADEHRNKLIDALNTVCKCAKDANNDGFEVSFGIQKNDATKNWFINQLVLAKHF